MSTPIGGIDIWPASAIPAKYLACEGQAISRIAYADLFAVIGTTYGSGDGSTTFNLPDYRGYFPRFYDASATIDVDAAGRTDRGDGTTGNNIGTKQTDAYKSHRHHKQSGGAGGGMKLLSTSGGATANIGSSAAGGSETRPVNICFIAIIKYAI